MENSIKSALSLPFEGLISIMIGVVVIMLSGHILSNISNALPEYPPKLILLSEFENNYNGYDNYPDNYDDEPDDYDNE